MGLRKVMFGYYLFEFVVSWFVGRFTVGLRSMFLTPFVLASFLLASFFFCGKLQENLRKEGMKEGKRRRYLLNFNIFWGGLNDYFQTEKFS